MTWDGCGQMANVIFHLLWNIDSDISCIRSENSRVHTQFASLSISLDWTAVEYICLRQGSNYN